MEQSNKVTGGVAIMKNGELAYEKYIGYLSLENKIRNNNLTKFRIASITKTFTATIIFQLIEEGRLTLETKLSNFYPQIPNSEEITIADLLGHRSGIHNYTDDKEFLNYMTTKKSKKEILQFIAGPKPDFKPDQNFTYSNSNYVLLGFIIEDVTKSTYKKQLEKRISSALQLKNTTQGSDINVHNNEAKSYDFHGGRWYSAREVSRTIVHGDGVIISTPNDVNAFMTALFSQKLISESSLNQMKEGYGGRGLWKYTFSSKVAFGHSGRTGSFVLRSLFFPDENVAVSVFTNGMNYNFDGMLNNILSIYFKGML